MVTPQSWVPAAPDLQTPMGMGRRQFPAMGTGVSVLAPSMDLPVAASLTHTLFEEWEATLSRFRPRSELSRVNRGAGRPTIVSRLFAGVLTAAISAASATDGIYDPTMLNQLVHAGYDRTFAELPPNRGSSREPSAPGGAWRGIQFDGSYRTLTMPRGIALDFGGIAKGMAVDAAAEKLKSAGVCRFAIEAGGDLRVHGTLPDNTGWPIAVETPTGFETIILCEGALATSSLSRRNWKTGDRLQHHILDPRTGEPAKSGLWSVTAVASQCVQADVAAKVAFILGERSGRQFLIDHGLSGLMVAEGGRRRRVGLPDGLGIGAGR
jgi:thiamine biosynthesis lipoprotein